MAGVSYKILVVDDEEGVAKVTALTLESEIAVPVVMCCNPLDAVQILQQEEIAVLISDFKMPGMNGMDLTRKAMEIDSDTVCILVTALATKEILISVINEGCVWKCLEKPWKVDELISVVKDALALYKERAENAEYEDDDSMVSQSSVPDNRNKIIVKKSSLRSGGGKKAALRRKLSGGAIRIKGKGEPSPSASSPHVENERYTNLNMLGEGGSGVIFRADDTLLGMEVAIKLLAPHIARNQEAIRELFAEARLAMQLSHKHIVRLHNIEQTDGSYYLVMEYIDGSTLRDVMKEDGVFLKETVLQIVDICDDAIGYAHRRHIYHRDIKPENFMVNKDGVLKIIDFGLACLAERAGDEGTVCGTPYYISPEELRGTKIDGRADVFSLAIMVHELLVGKIPFTEGQENVDMWHFVPSPAKTLSLNMQMFFKKAFAADPDKRFQDIHEFAKAFRKACV